MTAMTKPKVKKSATAGPAKRGRPTAYKGIYAQQAHAFCMLGADDKKLAELFEVAESTINLWKQKHPEFSESLKEAKAGADCEVAAALFKRAIGYSHPDVHVSNYQGDVTLTPITKHYPPDPVSAIFWLKNRQPQLWRDKIDIEQETKLLFPDASELSVLFMQKMDASRERQRAILEERGIQPDEG